MSSFESPDVRYQVVVTKNDHRVQGPEDAAVSITVPIEVATAEDFDATVEFMRGRLKAVGHTGVLFEVLSTSSATTTIKQLASHL
jgi:hypothetical protein